MSESVAVFMARIVLDANVIVSAAFGGIPLKALAKAFSHQVIEMLYHGERSVAIARKQLISGDRHVGLLPSLR